MTEPTPAAAAASPQDQTIKSPQEHIKDLEKFAVDGDIAGMAQSIGELHTQWDTLSPPMQSDVMKLEGIFLSILQARTKVNA